MLIGNCLPENPRKFQHCLQEFSKSCKPSEHPCIHNQTASISIRSPAKTKKSHCKQQTANEQRTTTAQRPTTSVQQRHTQQKQWCLHFTLRAKKSQQTRLLSFEPWADAGSCHLMCHADQKWRWAESVLRVSSLHNRQVMPMTGIKKLCTFPSCWDNVFPSASPGIFIHRLCANDSTPRNCHSGSKNFK